MTGSIDISGNPIQRPILPQGREFGKDDPSIRLVEKDKLWGLARADGSWLVEPKFSQADPLSDGVARVTVNGKVGFIDRTGKFVIEPVFDKAWWFEPALERTSAQTRWHLLASSTKPALGSSKQTYQQVHFAKTTSDHPTGTGCSAGTSNRPTAGGC